MTSSKHKKREQKIFAHIHTYVCARTEVNESKKFFAKKSYYLSYFVSGISCRMKSYSFFTLRGAYNLSRVARVRNRNSRDLVRLYWVPRCHVIVFRHALSQSRDLCFPLTSTTGRYSAC